ncbi:Non-specific serine/threonine protein kinase [Bertholletia excelsa]
MYAGVLGDGSRVAVHKVHCESEREVIYVLSLVEILSAIRHKNLAHLLGCCIDNGSGYSYTALVVYEYPANGTLEKHLHHQDRGQLVGHGLDLYKRMNIAAEIAAVLAFLQYDISPPIFHNDLQSGCIFLDEDFSAKISGFALLPHHSSNSSPGAGGRNICTSDVCSLGMVILEIIIGAKPSDIPTTALQKIRSGKLEEIVDPLLYYHEQPPFRREQIEILADLATRCLLFGVDGKLGIIDVARELMHMTKDSMDGGSRREPALEETFSNSSLLQMISMSPDSLYVP